MNEAPAAPVDLITPRRVRPSSLTARIVGFCLIGMAAAMVAAAAVGAAAGGREWRALLVAAVLVGAPGAALYAAFGRPARLAVRHLLVALAIAWIATAVAAAVPYLVAGTFAEPGDALYEATVGVTTSAATVLEHPEGLDPALGLWRGVTQWMGGLGILLVLLFVFPAVGLAGGDLRERDSPGHLAGGFLARLRAGVRIVGSVYGALTVGLAIAYGVAGVGWFDATVLGMTTASTGGLVPRAGSLAAYADPGVEWVAIVGMLVAGGSFARYLAWLRPRRPRRVPFEMRVYLGTVAGVTAAVALGIHDGVSVEGVRHALIATLSAVTTTGFVSADYSSWAAGAPVVLLVVTGIGAMSGSPGGGFRLQRALALGAFVREEFRAQIRPRLVQVVRLGPQSVGDEQLGRLIGFQAMFSMTAAAAAGVLALAGTDVVTAVSGAVGSIATAGPGLGDLAPGSGAWALNGVERSVMGVTMLVGRMELYPFALLVAAALAPFHVTQRVRRAAARTGRRLRA